MTGLLILLAVPATVLVLPPEGPASRAEPWVAEALADQLPRSLAVLGTPAVDRLDRLRAQAALEIPLVPVSRATSIRMAESLRANRIVTGSYDVAGPTVTFSLRLLDVDRGTLSAPLISSGPLESFVDLVDALAWDIALAGPAPPSRTRDELRATRPRLPFEAVKAFGLALASRDPATRITVLRRVLAHAPQHDAARLTLGQLLLDQREFSAAHEVLARIPDHAPTGRAARFVQGVALLEVGRYREAARLFAALADSSPTPAALNNHGLALLRDPARAAPASFPLRKAVEAEPESVDLNFNLAWALLSEGDGEGAAFLLRNLTRLAPLDRHTRVVHSWALARAGRAKDAEREWDAVIALAPIYESLVRPDLTRRFERILRSERPLSLGRETRTDAELAAFLLVRAQRVMESGDPGEALQEANRAAYLDPYSRPIHLLLARIHRARGQREKSLNEFRMALWSEDDAAVRVEVALLLRDMGRAAESRLEAEKALKLAPANEAARKLTLP